MGTRNRTENWAPVVRKAMMQEHYPKKYRGLFVVDLDGTLLNSEKQIARQDLDALMRLREMDYLVAIATGRSNYSFGQLMTTLGLLGPSSPLAVDYVIFSTGAGIMDFPAHRLLKSFTLDLDTVRWTSDYLQTCGLDFMIHKPIPDTCHLLYSANGSNNPDFQRRLALYREFAAPLSFEALEDFAGATQILCIVADQQGHAVAVEIAETCKQCSVIKATSPLDGVSLWIEIFAPSVSKSKAVSWLTETIGLQQPAVCAVGNDYNDVDLLSWAGQGFLVANGPESLHEFFPCVASNDNCGVSEAVARWLA